MEIAKMLGCSRTIVSSKIRERKLTSYSARKGIKWNEITDEFLVSKPVREIAKILGCGKSMVSLKIRERKLTSPFSIRKKKEKKS